MAEKKSKDDQIIMAVSTQFLFAEGHHYFQGFTSHNKLNFEARILANYQWMKRGNIEDDSKYKHPIRYAIVVNPTTSKVFVYQRAGGHDENRLAGNWSLGVGGHVEKKDPIGENPIAESMSRETSEEIEFVDGYITGYKTLGYINDDSNSVGKVHFGVLGILETNAKIIKPKDKEIARGEFISFSELEKMCDPESDINFENWSKIALSPLREYIQGLSVNS